MAIPEAYRRNFDTLLRAVADGNLALMECTDTITGAPRYVLVAIGRDGDDYVMTPFGHLHDGNPFGAYRPPGSDAPTSGTKSD